MPTGWIRWSGLAAMLGGAMFAASGILMALRPPGVEGGESRDTGLLSELMMVVGLLLIVVGMVGLRTRDASRFGRMGKTAVGLAIAGAILGVVSTLGLANGLEPLWVLGVIALLVVLVGSILLGIAALRADLLARAPAVALIVTALAFLFVFNTEDIRAVMTAPYGLANAWLGYLLWSATGAQDAEVSPAT